MATWKVRRWRTSAGPAAPAWTLVVLALLASTMLAATPARAQVQCEDERGQFFIMSLGEYRSDERGQVCFEPGTYERLHRTAPALSREGPIHSPARAMGPPARTTDRGRVLLLFGLPLLVSFVAGAALGYHRFHRREAPPAPAERPQTPAPPGRSGPAHFALLSVLLLGGAGILVACALFGGHAAGGAAAPTPGGFAFGRTDSLRAGRVAANGSGRQTVG